MKVEIASLNGVYERELQPGDLIAHLHPDAGPVVFGQNVDVDVERWEIIQDDGSARALDATEMQRYFQERRPFELTTDRRIVFRRVHP